MHLKFSFILIVFSLAHLYDQQSINSQTFFTKYKTTRINSTLARINKNEFITTSLLTCLNECLKNIFCNFVQINMVNVSLYECNLYDYRETIQQDELNQDSIDCYVYQKSLYLNLFIILGRRKTFFVFFH